MAQFPHPIDQSARIAAIGPYQQQARKTPYHTSEDELGSVAVLDGGRMQHDGEDQADGVDNDMSFAAVDFLAGIITAARPFSVVLTLWLSMIAALGVASRPASRRTCSRSESWICVSPADGMYDDLQEDGIHKYGTPWPVQCKRCTSRSAKQATHVFSPTHPASLAIIHQNALALSTPLNP